MTGAGPTPVEPVPFDVCGPLPTGTTVLEASAGTGKTYTIAGLTARYLAEGHAELGDLLLVTFGRTATNDLRTRVRERLVATERALTRALAAGGVTACADEVERLLCTGPSEELTRRRARIARALSDFDAATIATTHEFCLRMLDGLGVLADRDPDAVFVERLTDLTSEVAGDVYLRRYAAVPATPPMSLEEAQRIATDVVEAGPLTLAPRCSPEESAGVAVERVAYAEEVRSTVAQRKRQRRLFTYDDMLSRLRDALADPAYGNLAADRLRRRYSVVLVDEFQDTDPVQWEILRRAFHGAATLVLIGDPKQAVYAFRGADVYSYLSATGDADRVASLSTNWRSDQSLVEATHALLGGAALGDPRIVVREVAGHHRSRRLRPAAPADGPPAGRGPEERDPAEVSGGNAEGPRPGAGAAVSLAPIRLRIWPGEAGSSLPRVDEVRPRIVADLVADVTALLASRSRLALEGTPRVVSPRDIAVLVRRNERGEAIRDALSEAGVPAVLLGADSVFGSPLAREWLILLRALEQPRSGLVRRASQTCFVGWTFAQLATAEDEDLTGLVQRVRAWSRTLAHRGVAALVEAITTDTNLPERLLGQPGGERRLTDLRHLGQSLHGAMTGGQLGVGALIEWLREHMAEAERQVADDRARRLETDAESVQILTVHRAKGLEFPVVYLPELWDRHLRAEEDQTLKLHEAAEGGAYEWLVDVGGRSAPGRSRRFAQARAEEAGEELRLGYVALTRAQCQVIAWWAPTVNTPASALQRFLHASRTGVSVPEPAYPVDSDPLVSTHLGDGIALELLTPRSPVTWQPATAERPRLVARTFDRVLDHAWRRTSYSALTAASHLAGPASGVGSEPEGVKEDDESGAEGVLPADGAPPASTDPDTERAITQAPALDPGLETALAQLSPMRTLPLGPALGTAVHAILESLDFTTPDLRGELRRLAADQLRRMPVGSPPAEEFADALSPALHTPLGPLAENRRLADFGPPDRLAELSFELPLAGGDRPRAAPVLGDLAALLDSHLSAGDPMRDYPGRLGQPGLAEQPLRGYLTGSVDAVLRVTGPAGPRYVVVDYKTNWLGELDTDDLTVGHYTPDRLAEAMMAAHYPLQALLYGVAVHRFLRWRQPDYSAPRHLGGVLYLFVRGMAGPATPVLKDSPCGVFAWRPAPALILALSALLDGQPEEVR